MIDADLICEQLASNYRPIIIHYKILGQNIPHTNDRVTQSIQVMPDIVSVAVFVIIVPVVIETTVSPGRHTPSR
jgi:hypothetical protein